MEKKTRWHRFWEWLEGIQQPKPCKHDWASIAAPYVRQCRKCGEIIYREDRIGYFPDGLKEYIDVVSKHEHPRPGQFRHSFKHGWDDRSLDCGICGKLASDPIHVPDSITRFVRQ